MPETSIVEGDTCFLSYSRADEDFALRLARDLRSLGVAMWVDRHNIRPREHWDRAIERAIRSCRSFVVILSPRSAASENVADEISLAIDSRKPVIPVMIERCSLPLRLTRMHLIDATRGYEAALKQCLIEIRNDKGAAAVATPAGEAAAMAADPEVVATVTRELASIVGPIAGILVERAASRARSVEGLCDLLALHISSEADRERFVSSMALHIEASVVAKPLAVRNAADDGTSIRPAEVERIATVLINYLGPIAPILARKESRASTSIRDLRSRLAARLRCECDRADFLRMLEA